MDNIERHIHEIMEKKNNTALTVFEGYSPFEMQFVLYDFFNPKCVVQIKKLQEAEYLEIPIFNQIKFLLNLIKEKGELKLTKKGFLPVKVVASIYEQKYLTDFFVENGISKLYKEKDVPVVHIAKILLELSSLVKKRKDKLSLTKKGLKALESNHMLFESIFKTYITHFNWGYFDYFSDDQIGQLGFGFSLILLSKHGKNLRDASFYSKKYFKAFKFEKEQSELSFVDSLSSCYKVRTFKHFLHYFGLVFYEASRGFEISHVKKTKLFDKLIELKQHKKHKTKYKKSDNQIDDFFKNRYN